MAHIEVQHLSGQRERRKLSKSEPVSIGSHVSNDICVTELGVGVLHCRISWNGSTYEVVAGSSDGVELNGTLIHNSALQDGDVLRVGSVDVRLHLDGEALPGESEHIDLKPVTNDEIEIPVRAGDAARLMGRSGGAAAESEAAKPETFAPESRPKPKPPPAGREEPIEQHGPDDRFDYADIDEIPRPVRHRRDRWTEQQQRSAVRRLWERLKGEPVRPGEQDILRSPAVLGLAGGSLALLLAAATVWFIIGRETAQKHYDAAVDELGKGNYQQAADLFESFIAEYPRHEYAEQAHYGLGKARIERTLGSATPDWSEALAAVDAFIENNRDRPNYNEQKPALRGYAERIALGAARTAERTTAARDVAALSRLLDISQEAGRLVGRLSPPEEPPVEFDKKLAEQRWKAESAIEKREILLEAIDAMEAAIEDGSALEALRLREELLSQYDDLRTDSDIERLLDETLALEQTLVEFEEADRAAATDERPAATPLPLSLTLHVRSRTSEDRSGRTVIAFSKGCLYGIETVTGDPVWRRVVGLQPPFFPISVESPVDGLLLFDTNHREVVLLERATGALVWRQPLEEEVNGRPLVHAGEIYLATKSGHLFRILLESGRITGRVSFPRPVTAAPVLTTGSTVAGSAPDTPSARGVARVAPAQRLVIAAEQALLYTLSLRPLECLAVSYSGHRRGTIAAPLLKMGPLVLITENDRLESSRLRVFDTRSEDGRLKELARDRVSGSIHQRPVIRGRQLFVTSTPERITAFAVSDAREQDTLTRLAETAVLSDHSGPLFLKAGPDGQLWMAGSAFRRFQLQTDAINYDEARKAAVGQTTQPLQFVDRYFYVGRRQPYHSAVVFTPVEHDRMTSHWKTVLGASVLAWMTTGDGSLVCVTETGEIFHVSPEEVEAGGFRMTATALLFGPGDRVPTSALHAASLQGDMLAVFSGGADPRLWIADGQGRLVNTVPLDEPLQCDPVRLDAGVVLPLPGRLSLLPTGSATQVEDYLAPVEKAEPPQWRFLTATGGDELLALDSGGKLTRIRYRSAPVPHLREVRSMLLTDPVDVPPAVFGSSLVLCDASGRLRLFDLATTDLLAETILKAPATAGPWVIGDRLYVETARNSLQCFTADERLEKLWTHRLEDSPAAGPPLLRGDVLLLARQQGDVRALDPENGELRGRLNLQQPVTHGPIALGGLLIVATIDASLHRVESILQDDQ